MKIIERLIAPPMEDSVILEYKEFTKDFAEIKDFLQRKNMLLTVYSEEKTILQIKIEDILYFEAVKELVFAYTKEGVFEVKMRLYQVEEKLKNYNVMRASKSFLINLLHITSVRPALNGRLLALMDNQEEVMISRQYAKSITEYIMGDFGTERSSYVD